MPGQPIRREDPHGVARAAPGCGAQPGEGRAIKPGTADPLIHILMRGQQRPAVVLHMVLERAPLTLDGPFVLLLTGRDTRLECNFHACAPGVPE